MTKNEIVMVVMNAPGSVAAVAVTDIVMMEDHITMRGIETMITIGGTETTTTRAENANIIQLTNLNRTISTITTRRIAIEEKRSVLHYLVPLLALSLVMSSVIARQHLPLERWLALLLLMSSRSIMRRRKKNEKNEKRNTRRDITPVHTLGAEE